MLCLFPSFYFIYRPLPIANLMPLLDSQRDHVLSSPPPDPEFECQLMRQLMQRIVQISASPDSAEVLKNAVQILQECLSVDRVVIYQLQADGHGCIVAEQVHALGSSSLGLKIRDIRDLKSTQRQAESFTTQAIKDVDQALFSDHYRQVLKFQAAKSTLVTPLIVNHQGWGAVVAQHCEQVHDWSAAEIQLFDLLTQQVALTLERLLTLEQQQQQIDELRHIEQSLLDKNYQLKTLVSQNNLSTLQANAQLKNKMLELEAAQTTLELQIAKSNILGNFILKIRQSLTLEEILTTTTSEIRDCLQVDRLLVYRLNANGTGQVIAESVLPNFPPTLGVEFAPELFSPLCQQRLLQHPYRAVSNVVEAYQTLAPELLQKLNYWSVQAKVVVPILLGASPWGFIIAHQCAGPRNWLAAELDLLTQMASHVALSIEQAELHQRRQQAVDVNSHTENLLLVQYEQMRHVLSSSPGILYSCLAQEGAERIFFGQNLWALLGYSTLEAIETDFWLTHIHPEDRPFVKLRSDQPTISQEYRFRHRDGSYRWLYDQQRVVYDEKGNPLEWIGYCVDISDRRKMEEQLKCSLSEKNILLQEIHHRVKNNLNVIISLLNLQTSYLDDPATITLFVDSQIRIHTMALIHEQLYGAENLSRLDFTRYVSDLVQHLFASQQGTSDIELALDLAPVTLNLETATPCGLLLNELVTNAFKHAFVAGRPGKISISLTLESNQLHLKIQDDGVGFAPEVDWQNSPTLGLRLVRLLAYQLEAQLTKVGVERGTCFHLTFSELAYCDRL